ncbi:hypothetical protein NX059_000138 [Plenodomus lindquistii]|nr:hypothetical protein NX059_000138 [Plenodomus lindquistii]
MAFKFNLAAKTPLGKSNVKIPLGKKKRKPLLDDGDDTKGKAKAKSADKAQAIEELNFDDDPLASASGPSEPSTTTKPKKGAPIAPPTKKPKPKADDPTTIGYSASAAEAEARAREAAEKDATIYDYDAAYDALHAQSAAKAAATRDDAQARKPKYLETLLESAKQREKDHLRARDKLLQREREAEGDEFADKEKFVTGAYKAQQEEARRAEEEEKLRQQAEEEKKAKYGMQGFHKQMLAEQERRHQDAMDAAAQALKDGPPAAPPAEDAEDDPDNPQTQAQRIAELRAQGKTVILNEDGQAVDSRQLLSAGLNVIVKPKKPTTQSTSTSTATPAQNIYGKDKASRAAQRERQTQMVAEQIEAANKRKADEEAQEAARLMHAAKSQKTEGEIMGAKERYLKRKREAEAARAAKGEGK